MLIDWKFLNQIHSPYILVQVFKIIRAYIFCDTFRVYFHYEIPVSHQILNVNNSAIAFEGVQWLHSLMI